MMFWFVSAAGSTQRRATGVFRDRDNRDFVRVDKIVNGVGVVGAVGAVGVVAVTGAGAVTGVLTKVSMSIFALVSSLSLALGVAEGKGRFLFRRGPVESSTLVLFLNFLIFFMERFDIPLTFRPSV